MVGRKIFSAALVASMAVAVILLTSSSKVYGWQHQHEHKATGEQKKEPKHDTTMHDHKGQKIPAYYESVEDVKDIPKTLAPEQFTDPKTKQAYEVAHDNPKLLMQMPCFCYCDKTGLNHKSLLSCFVDRHGANCDICIDEAVMAAKLQKENLIVKEIREKIIVAFSKGH